MEQKVSWLKKVKGHVPIPSASDRDGSYEVRDIKKEQGQNINLTLVLNKTSEFYNTVSGQKETPVVTLLLELRKTVGLLNKMPFSNKKHM